MTYTKNESLNFYNERKVDKTKMWLLFLFAGWSYGSLGQTAKQVFFYLTLGGLGLWTLYVLFTLSGKITKHNRKIATDLGLDEKDMVMLGL
jgi:hypothetical protein